MRHRIVSGTGLGNPDPVRLNNKGRLNKKFAEAVAEAYFDHEGFDYEVTPHSVKVGVEPSYQYEPLKIIEINKIKAKSKITQGKSFGGYGSQVVSSSRIYSEYKYRSKFIKFVDAWHGRLFK